MVRQAMSPITSPDQMPSPEPTSPEPIRYAPCPHPLLAEPDNPGLLDADWTHGRYYTEIPTVELMRALCGPRSEYVRAARSQVFYSSRQMLTRQRLPLGIHDRAEEYIFADGHIRAEDMPAISRHLPFHLHVLRYERLHVCADEELDLSACADWWPDLHFREERYVYVHINKLTVEPGAELAVYGNLLVFCCDEIIVEKGASGTAAEADFDLQLSIRGTRHAGFSNTRRLAARTGQHGTDGQHTAQPVRPVAMPSIFGPVNPMQSDHSRSQTNDRLSAFEHRGEDGKDGGNGGPGTNGGMAMLADIRLGRLTNFRKNGFRIFARAGDGGRGGDGGNGGDGGDGPVPGRGGNGGHGGPGGNGGLASNIFIQVPQTCRHLVQADAVPSAGGPGGTGGRKGKSGQQFRRADNKNRPEPPDTPPGKPPGNPTGKPPYKPTGGGPWSGSTKGLDGHPGKQRAAAPVYFIT